MYLVLASVRDSDGAGSIKGEGGESSDQNNKENKDKRRMSKAERKKHKASPVPVPVPVPAVRDGKSAAVGDTSDKIDGTNSSSGGAGSISTERYEPAVLLLKVERGKIFLISAMDACRSLLGNHV